MNLTEKNKSVYSDIFISLDGYKELDLKPYNGLVYVNIMHPSYAYKGDWSYDEMFIGALKKETYCYSLLLNLLDGELFVSKEDQVLLELEGTLHIIKNIYGAL